MITKCFSMSSVHFLRAIYVYITIFLPRQARDKHRENRKKGHLRRHAGSNVCGAAACMQKMQLFVFFLCSCRVCLGKMGSGFRIKWRIRFALFAFSAPARPIMPRYTEEPRPDMLRHTRCTQFECSCRSPSKMKRCSCESLLWLMPSSSTSVSCSHGHTPTEWNQSSACGQK